MSEFSPARSPAHRITQPKNSATAYTSVSVALSQTVDMRPAVIPAAVPAKLSPVHLPNRLARMPQPRAVHTAESRLIERANPKRSPNARLHTLPSRTYSGVPGGCGIPSVLMAARNSPASHSVTPGARVSMYTNKRIAAVVQPGEGKRLIGCASVGSTHSKLPQRLASCPLVRRSRFHLPDAHEHEEAIRTRSATLQPRLFSRKNIREWASGRS
jgi:hypothetical protein